MHLRGLTPSVNGLSFIMKYKRTDKTYYCLYCGHPFSSLKEITKDHLVPKSRGGSGRRENLRPCCKRCNAEKGSATLEEYFSRIARKPKSYDNQIKLYNIQHAIEWRNAHITKCFKTTEIQANTISSDDLSSDRYVYAYKEVKALRDELRQLKKKLENLTLEISDVSL